MFETDPHPKLKLQRDKVDKSQVYFRQDPAVLIISATWHETRVPYGSMLRDNLVRAYVGAEDAVRTFHAVMRSEKH